MSNPHLNNHPIALKIYRQWVESRLYLEDFADSIGYSIDQTLRLIEEGRRQKKSLRSDIENR